MTKKRRSLYRYSIKSQNFYDFTFCDEEDAIKGKMRIKPSSVLWKPKGKKGRKGKKFFAVTLDKFIQWITDPATKARRVKK